VRLNYWSSCATRFGGSKVDFEFHARAACQPRQVARECDGARSRCRALSRARQPTCADLSRESNELVLSLGRLAMPCDEELLAKAERKEHL
jgi:hypothetical protein